MDRLTLDQFQQLFCLASTRTDEDPVNPQLHRKILPGGQLTAHSALEVYRIGHIARLTEALGETFEAVWWVAGDEDFFRLAKNYIQRFPSSTYNLSHFGDHFPTFLEELQPFSDLPFLPDLARFEWVFKEVFHQPPHQPLAQEILQHMELSGDLRLTFGPSVRLFSARHSIYEIWKRRGTLQTALPEATWSQPQYLLCCKQGQQVYITHLTPPEYHLLKSLLSGFSIDEALTKALQIHPDLEEATVANLFATFHQTGILTELTQKA